MNLKFCVELASKLIEIPSVAPQELQVLEFTENTLRGLGWNTTRLAVQPERFNILATRSDEPKILFTTHLDVVPVENEEQFVPTVKEHRLLGRGACDAKGIAAAMIAAAQELDDADNLALLFVVGEEVDGIGAKQATSTLKNRGIKYLVNGEPTQCRLATGHKGALGFEFELTGTSAHSGYPELGVDANAAAIRVAQALYAADFGRSKALGDASVNIGRIQGGEASNVISSSCKVAALIRSVLPSTQTQEKLSAVLGDLEYRVTYEMDPVELTTLAGFECESFSYCTDIPFLKELGAQNLLYGPGSIHQAHTKGEFIELSQLEQSIEGYQKLYKELNERI